MELFVYFAIFLFGIVIGSFLNVVVDRLPRGESFFLGRSMCDHCNHKLSWIDLVPVVSFLLLGGKCRYCHKKLSWYYPIGELTTGVLFILLAYTLFGSNIVLLLAQLPYTIAFVYFAALISALIVIFYTDLKYGIIPFIVVFFALLITFLWYFIFSFLHFPASSQLFFSPDNQFLVSALWSAFVSALLFFALFFFSKGRGLGFGDVVYVFLMGLLLGFPKIVLGLYFAFLSGAIISVLLVLIHKKKLKGETVPFGPFLVSGTIISLLWGEEIIKILMAFLLPA